MKSRIYLLLLLAGYMASAQNPLKFSTFEQVTPPSAQVSSMLSFNDIPVDTYTGVPDIQVPLYSKQIMGFTYDLALRFNPAGVRVNVEAGAVGTGWSLNTGGVVGRSVVGLPDEMHMNIRKGVYDTPYFNYGNLTVPQKKEYLWNLMYAKDRIYDSGPDVYNFSILNRSGSFILRKGAGGALEPILTDSPHKMKIHVTYDEHYEISAFVITDEQGYKYEFNTYIERTLQGTTFRTVNRDNSITLTTINGTTPFEFNSAWMLKRIVDANGQEICKFKYTNKQENVRSLGTLRTNARVGPDNPGQYEGNNKVLLPRSTQSLPTIMVYAKVLEKVTFRDSTAVSFEDKGNGFFDKIGKIKIKDNVADADTKAIHIDFNYFYNVQQLDSRKPFLESVVRYKGTPSLLTPNNSEKYSFEYTKPEELPGFGSINKDMWGYYNDGKFEKANKLKITTGMLKNIKLPTGGYKQYEFESNTFGFRGNNRLTLTELYQNDDNINPATVNDQFHSTPTAPAPRNVIYIYFDQVVYPHTSPVGPSATLANSQINFIPKKLISGNDPAPGGGMIPVYPASSFTDDNLRANMSINVNNPAASVELKKGWYFIETLIPWVFSPNEVMDVKVNFLMEYSTPKYHNLSKFLYGGGVRIKSTSFKDGDSDNILKTNYDYTMYDQYANADPYTGVLSSGSYDGELSLRRTYVLGRYHGTYKDDEFLNVYVVTESQNELFSHMTKGAYVGYKNVRDSKGVIATNGTMENGYTEYVYTSPIDEPTFPPLYGFPYPPLETRDYLRGNLLSAKTYNRDHGLQEKTENEYESVVIDNPATLFSGEMIDRNCPFIYWYDNWSDYVNLLPNDPTIATGSQLANCIDDDIPEDWVTGDPFIYLMSYNRNYHRIGMSRLKKKMRTEYFTASPTVTTEEYVYNTENYQPATVTTTYNEGTAAKTIVKEYRYPNDAVYIAPLVSGEAAGASLLFQQNRINEPLYYSEWVDGQLSGVKSTTYKQFAQGQVLPHRVITAKSHSTGSGGGGMQGYGLHPQVNYTITEYDPYNNPLTVLSPGGHSTHYVWGYSNTKLVAKVENSVPDSPLPANLVTAVTSATQSTIETALNNLRNGLYGCMATTYIHEPFAGVKSMTEPNGNRTTYEYDTMGRLVRVRDWNGNILSENQYNYRP